MTLRRILVVLDRYPITPVLLTVASLTHADPWQGYYAVLAAVSMSAWTAAWLYTSVGRYAVGDWLLDIRPLNYVERCYVGWILWWDGVARYPWPAPQTDPLQWLDE